ncbi:MAG: metallopeptidase family protein [Solirubrobacteraceae bacterium]
MRPAGSPTARRVALSAAAALVVGLGAVSVAFGLSARQPFRLLQVLAIVAAAILLVAFLITLVSGRMAGWREPVSERDFDRVVERSERLAAGEAADDEDDWGEDEDDDLGLDPYDEDEFRVLVERALDDLPVEFTRALEGVAVVVSDGGRRRRAYGLYHGDGVARDDVPDRIVIYRDTLLRDFGHDPDMLRAQVTRTVRHELAHHLGYDEAGVEGLGL